MVSIANTPVQVGDSYSTKYEGQATTTATDFIFSSVQDSIIVTNYGISSYITATSGGESVRIQPNGGTYRFKTDSDTVNIKSSYGATNPITIEGRSFASGQGGGGGGVGTVKKVNNVAPDANGNVTLAGLPTVLSDGQVTPTKTNYLQTGVNLYNKRAAVLNQYPTFSYRVSTYANVTASTVYGMSALIPLSGANLGTAANPLNFVCKNVVTIYGYRADGTIVSNTGVTTGANNDSVTINSLSTNDALTNIVVRFLNANVDSVILIQGATFDANAFYGEKHPSLVVDKSNLTPDVISIKGTSTIFLPTRIYANNTDDLYVDKESIITAKNIDDFSINVSGTNTGGFNDKIIFPSISFTNTINVENSRTGEVLQSNDVGFIRVDKTSKQAPATVKNVLIVGDSYTDNGYFPCDIKKQLVTDSGFTNFNFIGTRTDTINGVTCLNEGRGGYSWNDFLKTSDSGGRGVSYPNPFLNAGVVSLTDYMTRNGFSGNIDYCILELGVNNYVATTAENTNTADLITAKAQEFINMVHTAYPNCKIFLTGLVYISDINGNTNQTYHNSRVMQLNSAYQTMVANLPSNASGINPTSYCYYVDTGALFKRKYGFPTVTQTYRGSTETYKKQTDWLHPNEAGYYMMTDRIVSCIINYLPAI